MEFFASHDLPLCFLPCRGWQYQQYPALSATALRMFSVFVAPELSFASLTGKLFVTRAKHTESVRFCSQDSHGIERVKCPAWGCGSPDWNVELNVHLFSFTMIRFRGSGSRVTCPCRFISSSLLTGSQQGSNLIRVIEGRSWAVALRAAIVIYGG